MYSFGYFILHKARDCRNIIQHILKKIAYLLDLSLHGLYLIASTMTSVTKSNSLFHWPTTFIILAILAEEILMLCICNTHLHYVTPCDVIVRLFPEVDILQHRGIVCP
jgi:hypothetical protein